MSFFHLLKKAGSAWLRDRAMRLGAALAFYSAFSLVPLLVLSISLASIFLGDDVARGVAERQFATVMGQEGARTLEAVLQNARRSDSNGIMAVVGFALLLFSASGLFAQLKDALNAIWNIKVKPGRGIRGYLRDRFLSLAMVAVIGFLLLVSLVLSTFLTGATEWLSARLALPPAVLPALDLVVSAVVITLLFAAVFKILPDAEVRWRHVWGGAGLSALLFLVGKFGLAFYLSHAAAVSTYGAAGSLMLVLVWVYYSAMILLFGAEFTQVYASRSGDAIEPAPYAVAVKQVEREDPPPVADPPAEEDHWQA